MANALNALAGKKAPKKSKSKTPVVEQESLAPIVKAWLTAKERKTEAEADMAVAEQEFLPFAEEERVAASQAAADRVTSIRLVTSEGKVLVTSAERFSDVTDEALPALKKTFGKRAKDFFRTGTVSKIRDDADDETIDRMVEVLVEAGFDLAELFDVTQKTQVTKTFLAASVVEPALAAKRRKAVADGDLRPYKSRVRKG